MTATTIRVQMAQRKDTAANWTAANPILLSGEIGYETDTKKFKIGNGSTNWNSLAYLPIPDGSGNLTITGNLEIGSTGSLTFEGSTADGFETTLAVTNPTADRTITLPDVTGTVITSGDTGSVTSTMLADGTIVNADVNANAAIAGTKISPDFGSQAVVTTGTTTAASFIPTSSTAPSNGLYLSGTNTVALATASTGRLYVDASGNVGVGGSPSVQFQVTQNQATYSYFDFYNITAGGGIVWRQIVRNIANSGTTSIDFVKYLAGGFGIVNNDTNAANFTAFNVGASERARIDSSGRLLVGTSSVPSQVGLYGSQDIIKFTQSSVPVIAAQALNNDIYGPVLAFSKTRGSITTIVANNDIIGELMFAGSDGADVSSIAARIRCEVDGAPGIDDMPGRLVFFTTADGASSPTERVRVTSGGYFKASNDGTYVNSSGAFHELRSSDAGSAVLVPYASSTSYAGTGIEFGVNRAATTAFNFLTLGSSAFSSTDVEFNLRGDGNAFADGSWTGGGADYAEYFEWSDGNPNAEDRRGIAVVLDGDKIRSALAGEDPIGVISGNPSVVGDSAWNKWSGKYLRDDFGTYIQEDYEVINDEGKTVIQQRRKLNPAYDPDVEYTSREERSEWDCVGLMGKLRLRKGQPTGNRWIKMRDISDSVEEWLVR